MKVKIYHGSDHELIKPIYDSGKKHNDYGQGFYTTEHKDRAKEWALTVGSNPYCNCYELNLEGLNILNLDDYGPLAWIAEVLKNKGMGNKDFPNDLIDEFCVKYCVDTSMADVLIGYRADDSYFKIIVAFIEGYFTVYEVANLFKERELSRQVFLKSKKSFSSNHLMFVGSEKVSNEGLKDIKNNDNRVREEVTLLINSRRKDMILKGNQISGLTFGDALRNNYKYDKKKGVYYV